MNLRTIINRIASRCLHPLAPRKLQLPLAYLLARIGGGIEAELLHLEALCPRRGTAIDIGANRGFFSYRLSPLFEKVYAFEANGDLLDELRAYNPGNIEVIATGLSNAPGVVTLYTPVRNGRPLTGWASLAPGSCPDTGEHLTRQVEVKTLDAFEIRGVDFIKIDVEGHELAVLQGAEKTLAACRPVLLVEIREENRCAVAAFLEKLGYREKSLKELTGVECVTVNSLFVPIVPATPG